MPLRPGLGGQAERPPLPSTSNLAGFCLGGPVVEAGSPGSPSGLRRAAGWGGHTAVVAVRSTGLSFPSILLGNTCDTKGTRAQAEVCASGNPAVRSPLRIVDTAQEGG